MGTWGYGVYDNDSALDYLFQLEDLVRLDMWKELGIYVDCRQFVDGSWYLSNVHFKGSDKRFYGEDALLVWLDIVFKLNLFIYEEQRLGAYHMLTYCIKNIKEYDWSEECEEQRIKLLKKYRTKIRKYNKITDMFAPIEYSLGIKKENEQLKEKKEQMQRFRETPPVPTQSFLLEEELDESFNEYDEEKWLGWKEEFEERKETMNNMTNMKHSKIRVQFSKRLIKKEDK